MKKAALLLAFVTFLTSNIFAWGREGHTIVAQMAFKLLSPAAQQNVLKALGGVTIAEAGPWMDNLRDQHQYDFMKPWHYINIPKGQDYHPTNEDDIATHLIRVIRELQHKDVLCADQVKMDLLVLFHLMGDLHQPLHTGYGEDKGGNSVQVTWMGSGTNLHSVWDSKIIQQEHITLETVEAAYAAANNVNIGSMVEEWLKESRSNLPSVYDFNGNFLDEKYSQKNRDLVIGQLLRASIRLSIVLEGYFSNGVRNSDGNVIDSVPGTIKPEEAVKYIGKQVKVCGIIYGVKEGDKVNYLNMGAAYPNSPVTIVIFPDTKAGFKTKLSSYEGWAICVTGVVKEYRGKAEIVVGSESQIEGGKSWKANGH